MTALQQWAQRPGFTERYEMWLRKVDEWAARHKVTRTQAMSILGENRQDDWRSLLAWAEAGIFLCHYDTQGEVP